MNIAHVVDRAAVEAHFLERLSERYNITGVTYSDIMKCPRQGVYAKNGDNTIAKVYYNKVPIWCLYNKKQGLLKTVYPKDIDENILSAIKSCFSRSQRNLAFFIYSEIESELNNQRFDFATTAEAAIYYKTYCKYSIILIRKFKQMSINSVKICKTIKDIIDGKSNELELAVIKKIK